MKAILVIDYPTLLELMISSLTGWVVHPLGSIPGLATLSLPTNLDLRQFSTPIAYLHEEIDGVSRVSKVSCRSHYSTLEHFIGTGEIIGASCNVVV